MEFYTDSYQTINFLPEHNIVEQVWKPASIDMTEEEFKSVMLKYRDALLQHKPKGVLPVMKEMQFTVTPDIQEWIDREVNIPAVKVGVRCGAFVMPVDFFSHVSVEQTMEVESINQFPLRYFSTREEAIAWLDEQ